MTAPALPGTLPLCRCLWADVHCPNRATQEDGLCDWCGTRREDDLRANPNAMWSPITGEYLGLGGASEAHQSGVGPIPDEHRPTACWMPGSGRELT